MVNLFVFNNINYSMRIHMGMLLFSLSIYMTAPKTGASVCSNEVQTAKHHALSSNLPHLVEIGVVPVNGREWVRYRKSDECRHDRIRIRVGVHSGREARAENAQALVSRFSATGYSNVGKRPCLHTLGMTADQ
jgi:hypothetical protein